MLLRQCAISVRIVLFNLRRILLRTDGIQYPHAAVDAVAHHVFVQSVLLCNLQLHRRDEYIANPHPAVRLLFMSHRHGRRFLHIPSLLNPLTYSAERDAVIFRRLALCFCECHYYSSFYSMSNTSLISTSNASAIRRAILMLTDTRLFSTCDRYDTFMPTCSANCSKLIPDS